MGLNKKLARTTYESTVKQACTICSAAIEAARLVFLDAKRSARKTKLEAVTKAKQVYSKSIDSG